MTEKLHDETYDNIEDQKTGNISDKRRRLRPQRVCACLESPNVNLPRNKKELDPLRTFNNKDINKEPKHEQTELSHQDNNLKLSSK